MRAVSESGQVLIGDITVREVQIQDPGVEEAAQLGPRHPASLQQHASQRVLEVRGQGPEGPLGLGRPARNFSSQSLQKLTQSVTDCIWCDS